MEFYASPVRNIWLLYHNNQIDMDEKIIEIMKNVFKSEAIITTTTTD